MSRRRMAASLALSCALALALVGGASEAQRLVPQKDPKHWRVKYADSLVSINDRCAVKQSQLAITIRPVYVNGKPVGFCCTTCPPVFVQGPEPYLQRMKATFQDPVDPKLPAHVSAPLRYHVNWEIYYFADKAHLETFRKDVPRYCGLITDPVNGERFHPSAKSPVVRHAGRLYYFTSDATRVKFQATPLEYAMRKGA